jgi:hypothetical protein
MLYENLFQTSFVWGNKKKTERFQIVRVFNLEGARGWG